MGGRGLGLAVMALAAGACATSGRTGAGGGEVDAAEPVVFDGRTGARVSERALEARVRAADVVLVGERHGDFAVQAMQLAVLRYVAEKVASREGKATILAVEWIPFYLRERVRALDGLGPGESLPRVRDDLGWDDIWGHDFASYAPILGWAFAHVRVEPVNARREVTRAVARGGVEGVPPELRGELPPLDSGNDAHRVWFAAVMAGHGHGAGHGMAMAPEALARYYLAQLVWDETMAAHVRRLAAEGKVVVMAGVGHVERGLGIPARLGDLRALVVLPVADQAEAERRARDVDMPEREADLFWALGE